MSDTRTRETHINQKKYLRAEQGKPCSFRPPLRSGLRALVATCGAGFDS
nr:MAG TPA: hypothetical protein [Microviridae sp.]